MVNVRIQSPFAERRKAPRVRMKRLARVVQDGPGRGEYSESIGTTLDVSGGGVLFESDRALDPARPVQVSLALGEAVIDAGGRITHIDGRDGIRVVTGIEFTDLSDADRAEILDYCNKTMLAMAMAQ